VAAASRTASPSRRRPKKASAAATAVAGFSANRFAGEVCAHLENGRRTQAFGKLYVLGAPTFLGLMRKHQSPSLRNLISDEIAKDLTTQSPERIRAQLPEYL